MKQKVEEIPNIVLFVYGSSYFNIPIGSKILERAITEHPEYFPDEVEYRRKWSLIPKEVHDGFYKELQEVRQEFFSSLPNLSPSKGIIYWMDHPDELDEWQKNQREAENKFLPISKKIHNKYYKKYGIKWNGW